MNPGIFNPYVQLLPNFLEHEFEMEREKLIFNSFRPVFEILF